MNKYDPANNNAEKLIFKNKKPHQLFKLFHWLVITILVVFVIMCLVLFCWFWIVGEYWNILMSVIISAVYIRQIVKEFSELKHE